MGQTHNKKTKKMIYTTIIETVMTYGAETQILNRSKIIAVEMEYYRRCCGVIRTDKITNNEKRENGNIDAVSTIEEKII